MNELIKDLLGMLNKWLDFIYIFNKRAGKWLKGNDFQPENFTYPIFSIKSSYLITY